MADTTNKELIYSVKLDIETTNKALEQYAQKIMQVQQAQASMNVTSGEAQEAAKQAETIAKKTAAAIAAEEGSIAKLREQNKKLTAERNATTLATEEGRKKVHDLNKQLDENNEKIKENVDAYTKQKLGIGSYTQSIKDAIPFFNQAEQATKVMTAGVTNFTKALIATGIGLFVAALGALIAYFKGSEEGQNRLNQIMTVGATIMEKLMDIVENVGEALYNMATNPLQAFKDLTSFIVNNVLNRFKAVAVIAEGIANLDFKQVANGFLQMGTGVEDVIGKVQNLGKEISATFNEAITQGNRLAQLQAKIDQDDRRLLVDRQRVALEVAKLRTEAIKQEGDERAATIAKAIKLEEDLSDREVAAANVRLEQARLQLKANGDDKDAKMAVAQAEAAVIAAEAERYQATLRFQKELERIREEEIKRRQDTAEADAKFWQDADDRAWAATVANLERDQKARDDAKAKQKKKDDEDAAKRKVIEKQGEDFAAQSINRITGMRLDSGKLINNFFKQGALKQTMVNTETMATGAYSAVASIPIIGPILAPIAALAARAYGLASAAGISAITFARGGIAKTGGIAQGPSHQAGGIPFTIGGRPGYEMEGGEAIINARSTALFRKELSAINAAGGGRRFALGGITAQNGAISSSMETRMAMGNLAATDVARAMLEEMRTPQPPVLVLQDFEAVQFDRDQTANRARVI